MLVAKFDLSHSTKFFSQLEVVYKTSIVEGFSGVLYSSSSSTTTTESSHESSSSTESSSGSTTTTTGGSTETETTTGEGEHKEEETRTEDEEEMKSMTLMQFSDVTMSSAYGNNRFPARNALSEENGTFMHTEKGVGQYWKGLFAGGTHTITQVRVKNRADCCGERLSKTNIFIGSQLCGRIPDIAAGRNGRWYTLECKNPIIGNSIKLVTTRDDFLHFSQIEVYGLKK
jgi:hypothetical protein